MKIYGKDATNVALALDGAPSLVDNPRQLALERARKEQQKKQAAAAAAAQASRGIAASQARAMPPPGPSAAARPRQIESRGKSGKRRIQPMLLGEGSPQALTVTVPPPRGFTACEGFGSAATAASTMDSPRSGAKRPRTFGGSGGGSGSGSGGVGQQVTGTRPWDGTVVRLKSPRGIPMVSPPELMPRKGASGSLVRQMSGRIGEGGDAFRASPRIRKAPTAASSGSRGGSGSGVALEGAGDGGDARVAVVECRALEEDFRGLPARRYTAVTVTRAGREVWRDYVAGVATACCGNDRIVAVGVEDGSVHVYDR